MSLLLNSSSFLKKCIIKNLGNKILIIRTYQDKVKRQKTVPLPRGSIDTPQRFLEKIGRGCVEVADKFRDWDHLFTVSSYEMKTNLGMSTKQRKWVLLWTEHYRNGIDPYNIPIRTAKNKKKKEIKK